MRRCAYGVTNDIDDLIKFNLFWSSHVKGFTNGVFLFNRFYKSHRNIFYSYGLHLIPSVAHNRNKLLSLEHIGKQVDKFVFRPEYNRRTKDRVIKTACPHAFFRAKLGLLILGLPVWSCP